MGITPDTKDWTWVLDRRCPECGFDASTLDLAMLSNTLRRNAQTWADDVLPRTDVRERPDDSTWSPLEYACHVRDVFRLYLFRLSLMLTQDDPDFPNWDQDETAVLERYGEQDPVTVAVEVVSAGTELADAFERVTGADWERTGNRSDGARFTVESFARYLVHDPVHHLHDVGAS
jgi:hypothetical protein